LGNKKVGVQPTFVPTSTPLFKHTSPNDLEPLVEPELFIGSDDRNVLGKPLRDDLTVKWVGVMKRQAE
jgi:hypothetical protein